MADLGNSRLKWARVVAPGQLAERVAIPLDPGGLGRSLDAIGHSQPATIVVGDLFGQPACRREARRVSPGAGRIGGPTWFQAAAEVPVSMDVEGAEIGGADRALGVLAALRLMPPGRAGLVVSCGTAITVERVTSEGVWQGGAIAPGLGVMASALHLRTAQVPLLDTRQLDPHHPPPVWGRGTVSSLTAGIFWGTVGPGPGTRGSSESTTLGGEPWVVWAGGDGPLLARYVSGDDARIEPDLVLIGLVARGFSQQMTIKNAEFAGCGKSRGYGGFAGFSESSAAARADLKLREALRVSFPVPRDARELEPRFPHHGEASSGGRESACEASGTGKQSAPGRRRQNRRPNDRRSIGMDHRVVKRNRSCHRVGGRWCWRFRHCWAPSRGHRGRSSMSVRRRVPPGARAPSANRSAPPLSRISARPPMHRSAAASGPWEVTSRRALFPRRASPFSGSRGLRPPSLRMLQPVQVPQYGELELPADFVDYGTAGNMDLDAAINMLVSQNLDLMAAKLEIPMAEADVLTANLRANPIFYADQQLIPYGHFSFLRPGGPQQSDVNINYPLDISFKRAARTASAREAKSVTEAQLQDAVRNQIDNLYSVYEGVVSAGLTLKFSEVYLVGNKRLLTVTEELYDNGQIQESDLDAVKANLYKAQLQVRESRKAKTDANRALALILNMPLDDVDKIDVFDPVGRLQELPAAKEELVKRAVTKRPDLIAYKYGLRRAQADLKLAKANAYPDAYILYQPYTFQNNTYLGVPSAYSWTLGATLTDPLYNRNQGNVTRAKINITQTEIQVASAERRGAKRRLERGSRARAEPDRRLRVQKRDHPGVQEGPRRGVQAVHGRPDQCARIPRRSARFQ